jgi:hypothetical protein
MSTTIDRAAADKAIDEITAPEPEFKPQQVSPIDFLLTKGVRSIFGIGRFFRRRKVLAGLTTRQRKYIKARVQEIRCDDAFVIPVSAYRMLHSRYCSVSMGSSGCSSSCGGEREQKRLDAIIEDIYGTREQILRG